MRLTAGAMCLLLAMSGAAHPVATGSGQQVRRGVEPALRMVFVRQMEAGELRLFSVSGDVKVGQRYDLVDPTGLAGQVEVTAVESTDDNCPGFLYQRAAGRPLPGGRALDWNHALAVGPARRAVPHARVLPTPSQLGSMPTENGDLYGAVDLDGDGEAELARAVFQCDGAEGRPAANASHVCIADYMRWQGAWREVSRVRLPCL